MEDRLIRLEELLSLRDREMEALSQVVAEQQKELIELRKQVDLLAGRYRALRADVGEREKGDEPLPPHYLPR